MILVMDRIQLKPAFRFVCACFTHNTKNNNTVHDPLKVGDKIQTQVHFVFKKRSVTLGAPHDSRQQHTKPSEHSRLSEDTKRQEGSGQTATRLKASFLAERTMLPNI